MPAKTPAAVTKRIVSLRLRKRLGPVQLAARVGVAPSTVHRVLTRCHLNRLSHVDRATGEPVRRYEHDHPGSMLHVDVKKLGNIPDGGGWRYVGRVQGRRNRAATAGKPKNMHRHPKMGTAFVHTVIDDHSRVAYAEVHDDETAATATGVLRRAVAWFAAREVTVKRVLSDNGSAYVSFLWRDVCAELGSSTPALGPTGLRPTARSNASTAPCPTAGATPAATPRSGTPRRPASMAARVQPPPTPHRLREQATHHPLDQPPGSVHLGAASPHRAIHPRTNIQAHQPSTPHDAHREAATNRSASREETAPQPPRTPPCVHFAHQAVLQCRPPGHSAERSMPVHQTLGPYDLDPA